MTDFKDIDLSLPEKAAQILISFRFGKSAISDYCLKKGWGGIHLSIWDYKGFEKSRIMIEEFRAKSKIPPFITSDTECGFGQVMLEEATEFTTQLGIGATGDPALAYEVAKASAEEGRYAGLSWTYAPVVDINTNPLNPSTNVRAFGTDPKTVSEFALMAIKGYQENGLIATAKHFPGQGHSAMNSHYRTEAIERSRENMENCELIPFRNCIKRGVEAVMTNHAVYPAFDSQELATFSSELITKQLIKRLGFKGLIITDCLEMRPIKDEYSVEESVVKALRAGHDMVLTGNDFERSHYAVVNGVKKGRLTERMLDERIKKILRVKTKYKLFGPLPDMRKIPPLAKHRALAEEIARNSVRVERSAPDAIPLKLKPSDRILLLRPELKGKMEVGVHHRPNKLREKLFERHSNIKAFAFPETLAGGLRQPILDEAGKCAAVISDLSFKLSSGQMGTLNDFQLKLLKEIHQANPNLIAVAVNPLASFQYPFVKNVIFSYSTNEQVTEAVADKIFGGKDAR